MKFNSSGDGWRGYEIWIGRKTYDCVSVSVSLFLSVVPLFVLVLAEAENSCGLSIVVVREMVVWMVEVLVAVVVDVVLSGESGKIDDVLDPDEEDDDDMELLGVTAGGAAAGAYAIAAHPPGGAG